MDIKLHDKYFTPYLEEQALETAVAQLAQQIEKDFKDETPIFIGVLNGAFMFLSDLLKKYQTPCEVSFIKLASYQGTQSTNEVKQLIGLNQKLEGRHVIVVEDIVDTGNTIEELKNKLEEHKIKQLKFATLFFKPDAYTKTFPIDYIALTIPNKFIVGYGLDYDGLGRNLNQVYQLK